MNPDAPALTEDLATAHAALDAADPLHAAKHLAQIIGVDPTNDAASALLDRLLQAHPDPLSLVPLRDGIPYGELALRAALLARRGETAEAVELVLLAQAVKPEVPFDRWLLAWLASAETRRSLDFDELLGPLVRCFAHRRPAEALLPLLLTMEAERDPDGALAFVTAKALRTCGRVADAVAVARRAHRAVPDARTAVALGTALRAQGDLEGAIGAFREAVGFDDDDDGARLDIGDMLVGLSRWDEALASYEEVLSRDAEDDWALPSALFVRVKRDGDPAARDRLRQLADGGVERAAALLERLDA